MSSHNLIIFIISSLLVISVLNYLWLLKTISHTSNFSNINYLSQIHNLSDNLASKTFTYIYPYNLPNDKCYFEDCKIDSNLIDEKIKAFHLDLIRVSNNKIVILPNKYNIAPLNINTTDLNNISNINKSL